MQLRVSDQRYALQYDQNNNYMLAYEDIDVNVDSNLIVVDPYVCLFDDDWKIVDEVWEYLQYLFHIKKLSFSAVITKGSDLKLFYEFLQQHKINYRATSQKTIHDFSAWLSHCDLQPLNRIISSMKNFYQYHHQQNGLSTPFDTSTPSSRPAPSNGHTKNAPIHQKRIKIKEFDNGIRVLSKDQIETILNACTMQRDRILFELLLFTGIQIAEALSLDISSLGIPAKRPLSLDKDNTQTKSYYHQHKTGIQDLHIPAPLMEKLSNYYEDIWSKIYDSKKMEHEFFFISEFHNNKGAPLTYQAVWERCRVIGKKTGIFFTPEDFRHTHAVVLCCDKEWSKRLRELLGKTHVALIDIYAQIAHNDPIMEELIPFYKSYGVIHG
ncbi:MAG: tyrosine-type recombinase/integrase [Epsilonproteobacteria bacterium]|nr:tyrosine-type recombinase/integrase [Campylobacterota bacterium]